jgi:ParB/RepB/Spo0J family partition protein
MSKSKAPLTNTLAHFLDQEPGQELENARQLPIEQIAVNPEQSRQQFDEAALDELRRSIEQHGILEPLLVRPLGDQFVIIAGERRYRAAQAAGLSYVPVIIHRDLDETEAAILTALENLQREDLDPEDEARQFARLLKITGLSQRKLADLLGVDHTYLARRVKMLQEQPALFEAVRTQELTWRQALELLHRATPELLAGVPAGDYTWQQALERLRGIPAADAASADGPEATAEPADLVSGATPTVQINGRAVDAPGDYRPRDRAHRDELDDPAGRTPFRTVQRFSRYVQGIRPLAVPADRRAVLRRELSEAITMAQAALRALEQAEN